MRIPRLTSDSNAVLSFAQQRLWFLDQLVPGSALYNIPLVFDLDGPLDVPALERSLGEIVRRHEALRTIFSASGGRPLQEIAPAGRFALECRDYSAVPEPERRASVERVISEETRRPFDLATGPIFRALLVRDVPEHHVLVGVVHHIVFDGWSAGVFVRELTALYAAYAGGNPSPLPDLPIRYIDFAVWQRDTMRGAALATQLEYWTAELRPPLPILMLPAGWPRPPVQSHRGHREHAVIAQELFDAVTELSRHERVTPFITLLACYAALLHRVTGQDDILIGTPIANRTHQELEPLIGFFVNTLALRLDLGGAPTFRALLQRAKRVAFDAYAHQDLPFEKLVEELKPERSLSHSPILQTMLVLDNTPHGHDGPVAGGVRFLRRRLGTGTAKFDITLLINRAVEGRRVTLECNADLFDVETGARLLENFVNLLETVVADPDRPLERLSLMPDAEPGGTLASWNETTMPCPEHETVASLFEAQVALTPEADAILWGQERLTYGTLNARANRLARRLRTLNVTPDDRVGICLERTPLLLVGLLAILKAGGSYVPLDPDYPSERLEFIAQDAGIKLLLTSSTLSARAPSGDFETIWVDAGATDDAERDGEDLPPIAGPGNLAYVIYTSGSTGRPKGVAVEHRSVVNLITWALATFSRDELAGMLASTSVSFDLSVFEMFVPLASGGSILLVDNLLALPRTPHAGRVTFVNTVPSAMTELLRLDGVPAGVKVVVLAGEPVSRALVARLCERPRAPKVFDLYGPTEATVYATGGQRTGDGPSTIGRPIANMKAFVLDASLQPVPVGAPGELYLAGAGLARGYLGRPDLTADRFVPNPFTADAGALMYRTGDRARWLPRGSLEFIGRVDHQVKLRGFRIELGEIEATLRDHPGLRDAVVVKREEAVDDARLVAYVVANGSTPGLEDVRQHLAMRLPDYMVPSSIVALETLPRLPNGKVDRSALPARVASEGAQARVQPGTSVEEALARVWRDVLKLNEVSVTDNFFELGGHSLLATQVIARLRDLFNPAPDLQAMFAAPTVAAMARLIDESAALASPAATPQPVLPLHDWSGTAVVYPRDASIGALFDAQAARTPDARAVVGADGELTYAQLNARAQELARVLTDRGVGPDVIVGLCVERSVEQIVGLLAILKAGGAYLPLDPSDPGLRIAALLEAARAPVVVTNRRLAGRPALADAFGTARVVLSDEGLNAEGEGRGRDLLQPAAAESLAYVLFTSGSTGRPKAVAVPHRAVVRLVYGLPEVPLGAGQTVLQLAPLAFDASTFEIWGPLLHGGTVAVAPDGLPSASELEQLLRARHVTVLWLTAAFFNTIVDAKPDALAGVRHLLIGGEALSVSHVIKALRALPDARLINGYGPTEATTFACCYPIPRDEPFGASIPIGWPLLNTRTYVVDSDGRLVGSGAPGELWVGGDALARGYLHDAAATAERFGPDPFAQDGGRVYRTGDRVQRRPDGALEFIGRLDHQIKLRGFRIEPGEVEAALEQHPHVARAAVAARISPAGDKTLVAYVVAAQQAPPDVAVLRAFLHERLPAYMVPAHFMMLDTLPLLRSGKVDRRGLPDLASPSGHVGRRSLTDIEARLSAVWEDVLGFSGIGGDDNFFELGGHSLMAVRLVAEIDTHFGVKLPLSSLLQEGTIAQQARRLADGSGSVGPWSPIVPLQPDGARRPFFLVHGIGGEVLSFAPLVRHLRAQPVFGLCANASEGPRFFSSVQQVASQYVDAIRAVAPAGPYQIGGYSSGGVIAYEMAQQLRDAGADVSVLAMLDCAAPGAHRERRVTVRAAARLVRSALYWPVDDDFFAATRREQFERLSSKVRLWRARARDAVGRTQTSPDVRDRLGLWRYPTSSRELLEAHARMIGAYRPNRYGGTVTLLRARTMGFSLRSTPDLGWRRLADSVRVRIIRGAHDTILTEPRVRGLAAALGAALSEPR